MTRFARLGDRSAHLPKSYSINLAADAGRGSGISNVVLELAAGKGFFFNDRGEYAHKGFEDPVKLFELN